MKNLFKQLINDFQRQKIPQPTQRFLDIPHLSSNVRKAIVFIGMRRSGKTWAMYQLIHKLIDSGISQKQILYMNFEDSRLEDVKGSDLHGILEAYFELHPSYVDSEELHFFFDEIHEVPGWEKFIRKLLDTEKMKIYLSGSSAKLLSKEIATSLRGRTITREIFPYNFSEYLIHRKISLPESVEHLNFKEKAIITSHSQEFLKWGGFPETIETAPSLHRELLQGYIDSVIYRDIIDRYQVTNSAVLKRFITHCLQNAATLFSLNKVYQTLKSQGFSLSKNTLYQFLSYLEDAYCIFSMGIFHPSVSKSSLKPKKIYPVDQGLISAYGWHQEFQKASTLETAVFLHLRRQKDQCYYYNTASGREIDFLTLDTEGILRLTQVAFTIKNSETMDREVSALLEAMQELKVPQGTIVTLDEEKEFLFAEGKIKCIPIWKFMLSEQD